MLKEIYCDKFLTYDNKPRGTITFRPGLNTILGGAKGENSIGKSTFLLIIDFCFGGDTYAKSDVGTYVFDHTICFAFEFNNRIEYFSRSISLPTKVNICNEKYEQLDTISVVKFREKLMDCYNIDLPDTKFRDLLGRFFRISGKKNDTYINPLNNGSPKMEDAITSLEKLFGLYQFVGQLKKIYTETEKKEKVYKDARKMDLVPSAIKTPRQYESNDKRIFELEQELAALTQDTDKEMLLMELRRKDETAEIAGQVKTLERQYAKMSSQYRVLTKNRDDGFITTQDDLQRLSTYFPEVNMKKIEDVEKFHSSLHNILDNEMSEEAESLQLLIRAVSTEIQKLQGQLAQMGIPLQVPKPFLEKYSEIERQISGLRAQNESFNRTQEFKEEKVELEKNLDVEEEKILREIEGSLNSQMTRYNDFVYDGEREAPTINFESRKKYSFVTPRDGGVGTQYKSLIILDLSVLKLTPLPAVVHDSSIFKNIGVDPVAKIMELYQQSDKQIFIAFDMETAYEEETASILKETKVIRLDENGNELFGWSWAKKKNK